MDDRRQFYRIDDVISLNYKVVQADDAEQGINKANQGISEHADLRNAVYVIDAKLDSISDQLAKDFPLISELVTLINKKIALHERMMGFDEQQVDHTFSNAREVNLSASGVAFETETPITEGTHLKLEMVTYPEHQYIPLYARVVACAKNKEGNPSGYHVAVEFEAISEKDQERIMHHILAKQAEDLKRARQEKQQQQNGDSEGKASVG